jgi:hypothetical protein
MIRFLRRLLRLRPSAWPSAAPPLRRTWDSRDFAAYFKGIHPPRRVA